ncbi:MAG: shikimate kinase, partial [Rothia mucilaginosa]
MCAEARPKTHTTYIHKEKNTAERTPDAGEKPATGRRTQHRANPESIGQRASQRAVIQGATMQGRTKPLSLLSATTLGCTLALGAPLALPQVG